MKRALVGWFLLAAYMACQAQVTGLPRFGSLQAGGFDVINRQNLNAEFAIPVISLPGRGLNFSPVLGYNALIWQNVAGTWSPVVDPNGAPTWGWGRQTPVGTPKYKRTRFRCVANDGSNQWSLEYNNYYFTDPSGTQQTFAVDITVAELPEQYPECGSPDNVYTGYANGRTGYFLNANAGDETQPKVFAPAGSDVELTGPMQDTNGNYISQTVVNSSETDWTDTVGRTALKVINNVGSPGNTQYQYLDTGGTWRTVTMSLGTYNVHTYFQCSGISEYTQTSIQLPASLTFPDGSTYQFSYEPTTDPNYSGYVTGRIQQVTLPTGGYYKYQYQYGTSTCTDTNPVSLTRTVYDSTSNTTAQWTYNRAQVGSTWQTTVTEPQLPYDGAANQELYTFDASGNETSRATYQGPVGGTLLRTVNTTYSSGLPSTVITIVGNFQSEIAYTFDSNGFGDITSLAEYDWGTGAPGTLLRTTTYDYLTTSSYTNANILDRVTSIKVHSGGSGGTVVGRTDISYDGSTISTCPTGVANHNDTFGCSYTTRGNPTSVTRYTNAGGGTGALTTSNVYDSMGNVLSSTDQGGHTTSYAYSPTFAYAYATQTTMPTTGSVAHTTSAYYFFNTGGVSSTTDQNSQSTSYTYDLMLRPLTTSFPDGGLTTLNYYSPTQIETTHKIDASRSTDHWTQLDGLGRVVAVATYNGQSSPSWDTVTTCYDVRGQLSFQSYPYQTTSATLCPPTVAGDTFAYDALGRQTVITHSDSNTVNFAYSGRAVQAQDEGNGTSRVTRISQADGLGRTTSVCEVYSGSALLGSGGTPAACNLDLGATGFLTTYLYDLLDNPTQVTQGSLNLRTFSYNSISQVTQEVTPEGGTVTYTYDSEGKLYQRQALKENQTHTNQHVTTTYSYDALHRVTQKSYDDGTTPTSTFEYDESSVWGNSLNYPIGRLTFAHTTNAGAIYGYDTMGRVVKDLQATPFGYSSQQGGLNTMAYDLAGDLTSYSSDTGFTYTYGYSQGLRLTSATSSYSDANHPSSLASSVLYNAYGEPVSASLGNGISQSWGYDIRGRMTSISATKNSTSLYSVTSMTYAPNSTLSTANDSVNGNNSYGYDAFNRLLSAGSMTFQYDRYDNRWHENPGTQLSFDTTTNKIASGNGVTYDAPGNITNDSMHSYTYDAEGRILSADAGSTSYVYDALGRRVRKVAGGATHDYTYDPFGNVYSDNNVVGGSSTWVRGELFAGGWHLATYAADGIMYFPLADWLGTERARSDATGTVRQTCTSSPFGDSLNCGSYTDPSPIHFAGLEHDAETNLEHAWVRNYNSRLGVWVLADPAGKLAVDPSNPETWDRYAYAQNDPTDLTDPFGLDVWQIGDCFINYYTDSEGVTHYSFGGCTGGSAPTLTPAGSSGGGLKTPASPCATLPRNGRTIPVMTRAGQMNFQFNSAGDLIGFGLQLTGQDPFKTPNLAIPPNTFVGATLTSTNTVQFGFNNPVRFSAGVATVKQAYFQTATFSGGAFTEVRGAWAPFGIPMGSTSGTSFILKTALNDYPSATQLGNALVNLANAVSKNLGCRDLFGGN